MDKIRDWIAWAVSKKPTWLVSTGNETFDMLICVLTAFTIFVVVFWLLT